MTNRDVSDDIEEAFELLQQTWDLSHLTLREIFEAGFRAGKESAAEDSIVGELIERF